MPFKVKLGIIISVLLVLGIIGVSVYQNMHKEDNLIKQKDTHLPLQAVSTYSQRISEDRDKLKTAKTDDQKYDLYFNIATNEYGLGHLAQSRDDINKAINIKPNESAAYVSLFQTQVDMKDNAGAETSIKKVIEISPSSPDIWRKYITFEQGVMHDSNQNLNDLYLAALQKTNNNIDILTFYAEYLESVGNLEAAKEYWQKAIDANPANKKVYQSEVDRLTKLMSGK